MTRVWEGRGAAGGTGGWYQWTITALMGWCGGTVNRQVGAPADQLPMEGARRLLAVGAGIKRAVTPAAMTVHVTYPRDPRMLGGRSATSRESQRVCHMHSLNDGRTTTTTRACLTDRHYVRFHVG